MARRLQSPFRAWPECISPVDLVPIRDRLDTRGFHDGGFANGNEAMPENARRTTEPDLGRRRKILLYTHALAGGGAERAWALLASGLARRGHDVLFATDYEARDNDAYLEPSVRRVVLGGGHVASVRALARLIEREQPGACLSALCVSNLKLVAAATLAGRLDRIVISYHGFREAEPQPLSRLSFLLTPLLSRLSARTVAVSKALRKNLVTSWRAVPGRTRKIYNPVVWGPPCEPVTEAALRTRPPLVLASGRLIAGKNFDGLIRAFATVRPAHARLVVIGEGPERPRLEAEIARLGLGDRVELPGYRAEPWEFYTRATCLAVSSRSESFGMTVVEALAHGLPVVSTDCGGPAEILGTGGLGRLVPVEDEAALGRALSAALADPGAPEPRLERAARFSMAAAVRSYEELIAQVCGEARSRAPSPALAERPAFAPPPARVEPAVAIAPCDRDRKVVSEPWTIERPAARVIDGVAALRATHS